MSKKLLAVKLSKLKGFSNPKIHLEQYLTDPELAAEILWTAYMKGDIEDKIIADLGAGTGILGIGCLLLGAKFVYFVEIDPEAVEVLKENLKNYNFDNYDILNIDVKEFKEKVDTVVMNPPFGVQREHADIPFLEKATEISNVIYSIHNFECKDFIINFYKNKGFEIDFVKEDFLRLKATYWFTEKRYEKIKVIWLRAYKIL